MTYEEYTKEAADYLKKRKFTDEQITSYFKEADTQEILKEHYEGYSTDKFDSYSPSATASCLYMLY